MKFYLKEVVQPMETRSVIQHLIQEALTAAAASKPVLLQLAWYVEDYKVVAIDNTTILKPGEWLSVNAVDQINATPGWTVKMADNDIVAALFGLGTSMLSSGAKMAIF